MTDRREFLRNAGALSLCSAAGSVSLLTSIGTMAAESSGYKALVCVFLEGGMDNYDTILPYDQPSYDRYAGIRQSLIDAYGDSRARTTLLPLRLGNAAQFGARQFAVPAELAALHKLFEAGTAAIVGNVGPLVRPTTRIDFKNDKGSLPARLFSHNDQRSTWMSLSPEGARSGWGGRFADAQIASNANRNPAFSTISLAGNTVFLSGSLARSYQIASDGVPSIHALTLDRLNFERHLSSEAYAVLREHFASQGVGGTNLLQRDVVAEHKRAFENNVLFRSSAANVPDVLTTFPSSRLGQQLLGVARTIALREELGVSRQVFFADLRGFDTHSGQTNRLPALHLEFAQAIAAFYEAMQELGTALDVTLFTASDFGRTLAVNGDGTDHGWGGHHFVVGGSVLGGHIYGKLPPNDFDHEYDAGGGRLIPTVSLQQYAATLGRWFGLADDELNLALPGLENFPQADLMFV